MLLVWIGLPLRVKRTARRLAMLPRRFAGALQLYARDSVAQKRAPQPGVGRAMHLIPARSCGYGTSNGTV